MAFPQQVYLHVIATFLEICIACWIEVNIHFVQALFTAVHAQFMFMFMPFTFGACKLFGGTINKK